MENSKKIWFKRKLCGWGWVPATWQGWSVVVLYLSLMLVLLLSKEEPIAGNLDSGSNFLVLGLPVILLSVLFLFITNKKGEGPKWQWGKSEAKIYKTMKTLKCDLCDATAQGETFEAWMQNLMPHYMQAHADVMSDPSKTKDDQQKWMDENRARFEVA